MKKNVFFDMSKAYDFVSEEDIKAMEAEVLKAQKTLMEGSGPGNDFTGWIDQPVAYDKDEYIRIKAAAEKIKRDSKALVVIGIGGSYLGARAVIEVLSHSFYNSTGGVQIYFAGNNISSAYLADVIDMVKDIDFSVNVVSKSGTTTESALAFRIFNDLLVEKYGEAGAAERIYATTDQKKGALKGLADKKGFETFVVPDDIGGRYSVFSAVGLLPIAAAGIDIDELIKGAADEREYLINAPYDENDALRYAACRNHLYNNGKGIEILANYDPKLHCIAEWWKQLYGESEGKGGKGIFPASLDLTTDLHSMGQFVQDGPRTMFETIISIEKPKREIIIKEWEGNPDGLNYLAGKSIDEVNKFAMSGTMLAHCDGGVPNFILNIKESTPYCIGSLLYFFMYACGVSGYTLGVNPFDQPGVESYKKNMFALLGKPGYEKEGEELRKRL